MPIKQSLYDIAERQRDRILHKGFNYRGQIFRRSMSRFLFRDPTRASMLDSMEAIVYELIEQVKSIKRFANPRMKKNYRDFN